MDLFINIFHVVLCILLILVIILQPSKGSDIGAAFGGGGGSSTMFGPRGAGSVLSKATTVIAVLFMVTSISLAMRSVPQGGAGTSLSDEGTLEGLEDIDLGLDDLDLGLDFTATEEPTADEPEGLEADGALPEGETPAGEATGDVGEEAAASEDDAGEATENSQEVATDAPASEPVDNEESQ
jgi:preprotein translocase subunit SecG